MQGWLEKYPKKASILKSAGAGNWFHQFRAVALIRISPFPYMVFNYCAVATNVKYGPYIIGSLVGMVPEIFVAIYTYALSHSLSDHFLLCNEFILFYVDYFLNILFCDRKFSCMPKAASTIFCFLFMSMPYCKYRLCNWLEYVLQNMVISRKCNCLLYAFIDGTSCFSWISFMILDFK